jgi:hypothetical protein
MLKPILCIGCVALLTLTGCQNAPAPEQNLATIDGKKADTQTYAALLDEVTPKCTEDRVKIADLTTQSVNAIKQKGKAVTNLEMLSELRDSLKTQQGQQNCTNLYVLVGMAVKGSK